jgi:sulfate adenylyltransferase subunit 1 (EFTu-like GTPase family)
LGETVLAIPVQRYNEMTHHIIGTTPARKTGCTRGASAIVTSITNRSTQVASLVVHNHDTSHAHPHRSVAATIHGWKRLRSERFRRYLAARDKVNLDIFWLKDDTLDAPDLLPSPEEVAGRS